MKSYRSCAVSFEQVSQLQGIGLNAERRVDAAHGDAHLNRQARTGPHGKVLHGAQRARASGGGEYPHATEGGSRALAHDGELALAAEIIVKITLGVKFADEGRRLTLRRDGICDGHPHAGPFDRLADDLAPGQEAGGALGVEKHLADVGIGLALFIFSAQLDMLRSYDPAFGCIDFFIHKITPLKRRLNPRQRK